MFAYCGNNPANHADVSGKFWLPIILPLIVIPLLITGCSKQSQGSASEYVDIPAAPITDDYDKLRRENANCYAYAIGIYDCSYDPGEFSDASYDGTVESVAVCVMMDLTALGRNVRVIDGANAPINDNEYRIALRVSDYNPYRSVPWDYHFMVQTSSGQWAEKHGPSGATVLHESGTPDTISWDCGSYTGFYTSRIIYFAITPPN